MKTDAGCSLCLVEDENGNIPLHSSCEKGNLELVKVSYLDRKLSICIHTLCASVNNEYVAYGKFRMFYQ